MSSRVPSKVLRSQCRYAWWLITIQIYAKVYYDYNNIIHYSLQLIIFRACIVLLLQVPAVYDWYRSESYQFFLNIDVK